MANVLQELLNVCRFCLSEDLQRLQPIMRILDSTITPGEIDRYTGIRVNTDEDCTLYAICTECTSRLKKSVEYRTACINNQKHYEELLMMLVASTECTDHANTQTCDDDSMEYNSFEQESPKQTHVPRAVNIQQEVNMLHAEDSCTDTIRSSNSTQSSNRAMCNEENEMYSANYIEPGEPCNSDSDERSGQKKKPRKSYTYKIQLPPTQEVPVVRDKTGREKKVYDFTLLNGSDCYFVKSSKDGKRVYLKSLCDVCGIMVCDIHGHLRNHFPEKLYSCPHCSVKIKSKQYMKAHINTVHLKKIGKTCNICGKGFVHHKTYRYHMLGHQSEGKTYECQPCGKTFDKAFGLRDHYNRVHNFFKTPKQTS
ncbi:zinc finger protein 699-like isoform X2 [Anopheles stephensi]|uniref:zinc finger protein 699-like isoform X2 n=1 Tax=Anopheles stephensi TaxID=30069 RepID=UPI00165876EF|nr:zinc finger protein 699-like isoform X2 [Anopheles stephensi]